jgi:hypothetical protein
MAGKDKSGKESGESNGIIVMLISYKSRRKCYIKKVLQQHKFDIAIITNIKSTNIKCLIVAFRFMMFRNF